MLDEFLILGGELSKTLLPIVGVILLISLTVLVIKIIKIINRLPVTIEKVNQIIDTSNASIDKLDVPLNTIVGLSKTVDTVNKSATGIVSSFANYAVKNSDQFMNWTKDKFTKNDNNEEYTAEDTNQEKEEDFGIYE